MHTIPKIIDMIQAWHTDESADPDQHGQLAEIEKAIRALAAAPAKPEATGHAHAYPLFPPQQFRDYVAAHYQGEVVFSDTEWHARRLWSAAMKAGRPEGASAGPVTVQKYDDTLLPFLELMRKKLHANAYKGDRPGWLSMSADKALLEIYWHTAKLSAAVKNNDGPAILEYSADVANMAMMLLDVCGGLGFEDATPAQPAVPAQQLTPAPAAAVDWSQAGRLIEAAGTAAAHGFMTGTSNWAAAVCHYMDPTTPTPQAADSKPAPVLNETALHALFREALAWGKVYGEAILEHQWDEIRESMVVQYVNRASCGQAPAGESAGKFPRTTQEQAHD